jgi:hypothetical protein
MVRPERRVLLTGESPVWVSAGAPDSRSHPAGEILAGQSGMSKVRVGGEQTSGLQRK